MKKVVFFDWGGVLGHDWMHKKLYGNTKIPLSEAQHLAGWNSAAVGAIPEDYYWTRLAEVLEYPKDDLLALAHRAEYNDRVFELARMVKDSGHRIAILSNNLKVWLEKQSQGKVGDFEAIFNSAEMGTRKPEVQMYLQPLSVLGASAENAYLIDDKQRNIEAAEALGWTGILFTNPEQLEIDLGNHGLI